jgi:glycyl-tRNA synthetase beta chain
VPELLLELFSEEIPARMQARAVEDLARLVTEALSLLSPTNIRTFYGLRRIALAAEVAAGVAESRTVERGPRASAPEQALAGFLRKHGATREQVTREGEYWVLHKVNPGRNAGSLIAAALPELLWRFPWPKSMRWGGTSAFTWVRPLRRMLCLLDGEVVRFDLRSGSDDGHGLASGDLTEAHRFLAPGAFRVASVAEWKEKLRERHVAVEAAERKRVIREGAAALAEARDLGIVEDEGLLDEVAGLVEWPAPLLGRIDAAFMDLPPEVMQVSMRVNQRYFALRNRDGSPAPWFAFVANVEAPDGGAAIVAGNERVLRARFADARHFWGQDRKVHLASRVPALDHVVFHAKLGSQGDRVRRLARLAGIIAPLVGADVGLAERAALLAKADLTTGMVGEFPELQGVMGRYYALHDGESPEVADAIRDHYAPRGASDSVPAGAVSVAVALADKLDLLAGFFRIAEVPTGSGDPYALRRAASGMVRLIQENRIHVRLGPLLHQALFIYADQYVLRRDQSALDARRKGGFVTSSPPRLDSLFGPDPDRESEAARVSHEIMEFVADRLRVKLRAEGAQHDVLSAVFAAGEDDDVLRLLARTDAVAELLATADGLDLLIAYKRAANILRIEDRKDGPHQGPCDNALLRLVEERSLAAALDEAEPAIARLLEAEDFTGAMEWMAQLRASVDTFFDKVTVNAPEPELRRNRLRLLARLRDTMNRVADFSKIEG